MAKSRFSTSDRHYIARLWRDYVWPQKHRLVIAAVFMVILAVATAAYTWVVRLIIDAGEQFSETQSAFENVKQYALVVLPLLIGLPLISGVSNYIQRIYGNAIALHTVGDMQKQMFASTHQADFELFSREPIGTIIAKFINDVTILSNALIRALSNLIKDLLTVIFTIILMFVQNWSLTVMVLLLYPIAAWPIISISKRLRGSSKDVQEHVGHITSDLKESFSGARMIKAYGLEDWEQTRLSSRFDERIRLFLKLVTEQARVDPILELMGGLAIAGVVIFGGWQISTQTATPGSIAAVLTGLLLLSPRIRALGTLNNVVQEGLSALTRIFQVIDEIPTITDSPQAHELTMPRGDIRFDDVSFAYPDGTEALSHISLDAKLGQTIALVGESGGGKSTIINLVPRLFDVTKGAITIDGHNIRDVSLKSLRQHIALVSQDTTLFNDTVAANIALGDLTASKDDIIQAAKAADAHDFISRLPQGYETRVGEDGDNLSGGQKQRISIARAILKDAPILLLDEATSALDTESEAKVQKALARLSRGRTTFVIAHRLSTVRQADQIYVLEKGQIIETGTHQSLMARKGGTYARLKSLQ